MNDAGATVVLVGVTGRMVGRQRQGWYVSSELLVVLLLL